MRRTSRRTAIALAVSMVASRVAAQQFNSDNYLSKPPGVATVIVSVGQRSDMFMTTFALVPRWEFTAAAYLFNKDNNPRACGLSRPDARD